VGAPGTSTAPGAPNGVVLPQGAAANGRLNGATGLNNANANGRASFQSNISRTPFFTDPGVRQQLNLNDSQFNSLNQAYQNAYTRFNQGMANLNNPNMTEQQRAAQLQQLEGQFNQSFGGSLNNTFTDRNRLNRFNQLSRQSQGFNAFNDPTVRRELNLTQDQVRQLRTLSSNWRQQLHQLRNGGANGNSVDSGQWAQMQQQFATQLNGVLSPQQRQMWTQMTGQPFSFSPNSFSGFDDDVQRPRNTSGSTATGTLPNQTGTVGPTVTGTATGSAGAGASNSGTTNGTTGTGTTTGSAGSTTPTNTAQGTQGGTVR